MSDIKPITLAGRLVGPGQPPCIVAEMSANHLGDRDRALAIIDAAHAAGADAVKLQTYTADTLTIDCARDDFVIDDGLWAGWKLYDLYRAAHTPWDWHADLFERGRQLGITVFSTPFDLTALDLLETLDCPAYKIASFEATDLALVEAVAATGKPLILSTGLATLAEIEALVAAARGAGCRQLAVLHCVSAYPAPPADSKLLTIPDLARRFDVVSGLSDHTLGTATAVAAVALGASMIEKHFTLARADGGPDGAFSLEPAELAALCADCHTAREAAGEVDYSRKPSEAANLAFRRSLYAVDDIDAGAELTTGNVRCIRPGFGLPPEALPRVLGRRAARRIARGTALDWNLIGGAD